MKTLADKIDLMIRDLSRVVATANKGRDFKAGLYAQEAIAALGRLRNRDTEDHDWAEWKAWPPQAYPPEHEYHGLMDVSDIPPHEASV